MCTCIRSQLARQPPSIFSIIMHWNQVAFQYHLALDNSLPHRGSHSAILVIYDTGQRRVASSPYSCHPATGPVLVFTSSESERTPAAKTAGFFCTCARDHHHESDRKSTS